MQFLTSLLGQIDDLVSPKTIKEYLDHPGLLIRAVCIPAPLGGFMYGLHSKILVRNTPDTLVCAIADMKRLIKAGIITEQDTCRFIFQTPSNCGWLKLMEDPYSLNIPVTKSQRA